MDRNYPKWCTQRKKTKNNWTWHQWPTGQQIVYIYAIRVLEGEKRDGWTQKISEEIMAENVPNLMKSINSLTQEAKQTSRRISIFLKTHQGTSQSNYWKSAIKRRKS